jgi:diguanylate cyclase (GGDEF)-like protein
MDLIILPEISASVATEQRVTQEREHFRRLSELDGLTEIYNRRTFDTTLTDLMRQADRRHQHLALLMADIDHFKQVNDTFGPETGDRVLQDLTQVLQSHLRPADRLARYGGEEFMIIIPNTPPSDLRAVAERLRIAVASYDFTVRMALTISVGVTRMQHHDTPQKMIQRVDRSLYAAKHAGRNCVVVD